MNRRPKLGGAPAGLDVCFWVLWRKANLPDSVRTQPFMTLLMLAPEPVIVHLVVLAAWEQPMRE